MARGDDDVDPHHPLGTFEPWVRTHKSPESARAHVAEQSSTLDFRVAKALGSKGYNKLRLSVVGNKSSALDAENFDYAESFQYRWQAAYDLGTAAASCSDPYDISRVLYEGECLKRCSADSACSFFTFSWDRTCSLASTCDYTEDRSAEATYHKTNDNYLYSSVVDAVPGKNEFTIGGQTIEVNLPEEDGAVSGILWSDPCYSSKWIACVWGSRWDVQNRSIEMINALAEDDSWHFFQILGDNFYGLPPCLHAFMPSCCLHAAFMPPSCLHAFMPPSCSHAILYHTRKVAQSRSPPILLPLVLIGRPRRATHLGHVRKLQ